MQKIIESLTDKIKERSSGLKSKKLQLSRPGVMSSRLLVLLRRLMGLGGEKHNDFRRIKLQLTSTKL